ncbi:N-acetylmuramoyl-L-alanine amidase [Pectobacterium phage DU_PP_V]|uniref:N-acetylmuramoyl-L-alanine amidase n=1 Tax=Pectobacterium phage DU_PP_V TaxID=2041492 RepID=A0A2D2W737_9CAUD|nr:N-acetylmuramoyl-L-alanine amidase [Pectobacterium phage DU_PP_V]ATS94024.1 N-acetylmuramoyl-L-alanine amidase [Pectobacterium phage DU_PP_V]
MKPFEFTQHSLSGSNPRIIIIDEVHIMYEQPDGSCIINNESIGRTYRPNESYEEMRRKFLEE